MVHRIVDAPLAIGEYRNIQTWNHRILNAQWTLSPFNAEAGGIARIWDAQSICFNGKVQTPTSYSTIVGNTGNATTIQLKGWTQEFEIRSQTQYQCEFETYVCHPKKPTPSDAPALWNAGYGVVAGTHLGLGALGAQPTLSEIGSEYWESKVLREFFHVKKYSRTILPGGEFKFKIHHGPKTIKLPGENTGTLAVPAFYNYDKNCAQSTVFFRARGCIGVSRTGILNTGNEIAGANFGGFGVMVKTTYKVKCPENLADDTKNIPNVFSYVPWAPVAAQADYEDIPLEDPDVVIGPI